MQHGFGEVSDKDYIAKIDSFEELKNILLCFDLSDRILTDLIIVMFSISMFIKH